MKLTKFRVKNYKVIDDTGWVPVDSNLTALVGKNESGKTAILRALWKSSNVVDVGFDKLHDYPIERYAKERQGTQEVTSLEFDLSPDEVTELTSMFKCDLETKPKKVIFTTYYDGEDDISTEVSFEEKVQKSFFKAAAEARSAVDEVIKNLSTYIDPNDHAISEAHKLACKRIPNSGSLWEGQVPSALKSFDAAVSEWIEAKEGRQLYAEKERGQLDSLVSLAERGDPAHYAKAWVEENIPVFIYFEEYGQLETRISLPTYLSRVSSEDAKARTQQALFSWSSLNPNEILELGVPKNGQESEEQVHRRKDKRRTLLSSASFSLTGDWVNWWPEKRHKLNFDADGEDLVLTVSDEHNDFPIFFGERSKGFQWFFSFYLVFLVESQKAHKGAILLLDEPGLHLHPTLQSKLIDLFGKISQDNQLIYSTHLPFLVDGNHLERVRTVHLAGDDPQKSVVSTDLRSGGDRDTLFPIQAALGYSIAQTLFLGKRSVIVEGITDYWLMKTLDCCLASLGEGITLHEDTVLVWAGGISRMMPLASIMFSTSGVGERKMLVLLDSDAEGTKASKRFQRDLFGDDSRILMLGHAVNLKMATVEDIIPRDIYTDAVVKRTGQNITLNEDELNAPTNVSALERACKRTQSASFGLEQKVNTIRYLTDMWNKDPALIPEQTKELASLLFSAINNRF